MKAKVESHSTYSAISLSKDGLGLLCAIKSVAYQIQNQKNLVHTLTNAIARYYCFRQGKFTTPSMYLTQFQNILDVITMNGGEIAGHPGIVDMLLAQKGLVAGAITEEQRVEIRDEVRSRSTAMVFLLGSDRTRYGKMIDEFENDFLKGIDHYPTTVNEVYNLLTNWKMDSRATWQPNASDGVSFVNSGDDEKNDGPRTTT